jgi:hypothetical protein
MSTERQLHPFLPTLRDDHLLSGFNSPGGWERRGADELSALAASLADAQTPCEIHGIPSPWARPIALGSRLIETDQPAYRAAVGEWRGLLTVLALARWRELKLLFQSIPWSDGAHRSPFIEAVAKLAPRETLAPGFDWRQVCVIVVDGVTLGITSPATLVCPAADYDASALSGIHWVQHGRLVDPLKKLSALERGVVRQWLQRLGATLGLAAQRGPLWAAISRAIQEFVADLAGPAPMIDVPDDVGAAADLRQRLEAPAAIPVPFPFNSDVWLRTDRGGSRRVLLVPGADEVATLGLGDLVFWRTQALRDVVAPRPPARPALPAGVESWSVDQIFEDNLIVVPQANAFPGARQPAGGETVRDPDGDSARTLGMLLPLRPRMLEVFSPERLASSLRIASDGGAITVYFDADLESDSGAPGQRVTLSRRYSGDAIVKRSSLPVIEVWPNMRREGWKSYYAYIKADPRESFTGTPVVADKVAVPDLRRLADPSGEGDVEITRMAQFPEAIRCEVHSRGATGLLLLNAPLEVRSGLERKWRVGVDFGTSGTVVYRAEGEQEPQPLRLPSRLLAVTGANPGKRTAVDRDFVPTTEVPLRSSDDSADHAILSVFAEHPGISDFRGRPLLDGRIYFVRFAQKFEPQSTGVHANLKWGEKRERELSQVFLQQLCMHISAEAALEGITEIEWHFSYPSSFSGHDIASFTSIWEHLTVECRKVTGIRSSPPGPRAVIESVAVAAYYANRHKAPIVNGIACVDIGGGSSDIAVWQDGGTDLGLHLHSSVRLAARDLFSGALQRNLDILTAIDPGLDLSVLQDQRFTANRPAFYSALDAFLQAHGNALLEALLNQSKNPRVERFLDLLRTGLGGLLYYVGMLVRYGITEGLLTPHLPDLYIGGNGSKILHWACNGRFQKQHPFVTELKRLFVLAYGADADAVADLLPEFSLVLSSLPKSEVAYGLVTDAPWLAPGAASPPTTLAGETYTLVGTDIVAADVSMTRIDRGVIKTGIRCSQELESLTRFLALRGITPAPVTLKTVSERVAQRLFVERHKAEADIRVESLFIMALGAYLDVMTEQGVGVDQEKRTSR